MAIIAHPLTAIDGTPVYTAQDYRFAINPFLAAAPVAASPFACYQGVRAGAAVPLVSLDSLTATVHPHAGILCPWPVGGAYSYAITQDVAIQIPSSQGVYKLAVVLTDPSVGHGDTPGASLKVFDGTTPDSSIPGLVLATVTDGAISDQAPLLNADGSITVRSKTALDTLTALDGQTAHVGSVEYKRVGGAWVAQQADIEAAMPYQPVGKQLKLHRDHNTVIASGRTFLDGSGGFTDLYVHLATETIPNGFRPKDGTVGIVQALSHSGSTHFWYEVHSDGEIYVSGTMLPRVGYGYTGVWFTA